MRNYSMVYPQFWTGQTGRMIASLGLDEVAIACYLMTCPAANAIGFYYLPIALAAQQLNVGEQRLRKALAKVCATSFATYDDTFRQVWVCEMARYQIGERLRPSDLRVKGVHKALSNFIGSPLLPGFVERYRDDFHLTPFEGAYVRVAGSPLEPPLSKPMNNEQGTMNNEPPKSSKAIAVNLATLTIPAVLQSPEALQAIQEWLEYKQARGEAYKRVSHFEKKLAEFANPSLLVAAVNHSIGSNYQGLFPPKNGSQRSLAIGPGQSHPEDANAW